MITSPDCYYILVYDLRLSIRSGLSDEDLIKSLFTEAIVHPTYKGVYDAYSVQLMVFNASCPELLAILNISDGPV